jgi:hypothetical protein
MVQGMNLKIPIGNADAGAYFNNKVLAAVDYGVCTAFQHHILGFNNWDNRWLTCIHGLGA